MRALLVAALALLAACGGNTTSAPNLTTTPADLAGVDLASSDLAPWSCPPLADFCRSGRSAAGCPASAAAAEALYCHGDAGTPGVLVSTADCGAYVEVAIGYADFGFSYFYDAASGALVAVVENGYQGTSDCVGGPATFTLPGCPSLAIYCS